MSVASPDYTIIIKTLGVLENPVFENLQVRAVLQIRLGRQIGVVGINPEIGS